MPRRETMTLHPARSRPEFPHRPDRSEHQVAGVWRILRKTFAGGVILALCAVLAVYMLASFSLPRFSGTHRMAGIDARVEIVRDAHGIPRIFAKTPHDAWFALGYVHAVDRLWQMDVARRLAQGRLSERFGVRALSTDRLMRALDMDGHAERALGALSEEALDVLEAYAAGVNARIRQNEDEGHGRGAPEFYVFGGDIDEWVPADSLSILKGMAFQISRGALAKEVKRGRFLLGLEPQQVHDLVPEYPGQGVGALPLVKAGGREMPDAPLFALGDLTDERAAGASNAWAVDGRHTASRAPLLASDPHLPLTAPGIWHPVQVGGPGIELIGASLPGLPAIVIGRNDRIAWGITAAEIDDLDVFVEQVDPEDPTRYRTPDGWEAFESREEVIRIDGAAPVGITVQRTRHGPVLPITVAGLAAVTPRNHVPSLAWTALTDDDTSFEALVALNRAGTVAEALRAADTYVAPALNLVVADAKTVGMGVVGRVPLRRLTSRIQGRVPTPGWKDDDDWIGWIEPAALPRIINPASGAVANANNRVGNAEFPRHLSFDWDAPYRLNRIIKQLDAREAHSVESFRALQMDSVSEMARAIAPLIGKGVWDSGEDPDAHPLRADALDRLRDWNGSMSERGPEGLIFTAWLDALVAGVAGDELGPLSEYYRGSRPLFIERVYRDIDDAGRWCDDIGTDGTETCRDIAAAAIDTALTTLAARYGAEIDEWRWGAAHRALHRHSTLGDVGTTIAGIDLSLGSIVNIEHETSGGDYTLNRGAMTHSGPDPYANVHASGLRAVFDLADLDRSMFIVSTGAVGHPLSEYYDNLAPLWRSGDLVPMSTDRKTIESGALGTLVIAPDQDAESPMLP